MSSNIKISNEKSNSLISKSKPTAQDEKNMDQISLTKSKSSSKLNGNQNKKAKRKRPSLFAPVQPINYGPKATLSTLSDDNLLIIQDPLSQRLTWYRPPSDVLLIKKRCGKLTVPFIEIIEYLINKHNLKIYVERAELEQDEIKENKNIQFHLKKPSIYSFTDEGENLENKIDLVICLGGDGTLLHVSNLFQRSCPPVLSINMGSLGFLCPFDFDGYRTYIDSVVIGNVPVLLRTRLTCKTLNEDSSIKTNSDTEQKVSFNLNDQNSNKKQTEWLSLNEIVISRGSSSYLSHLDLYLNDYLVTTVQGDGIIISTATGSTAYAMAAGASMCHPSVPAIIICPICPHSLSFRPIVVPAGIELTISSSSDARNTAACSVDGKNIGELKPGESLFISSSEYPLPSICRNNQTTDWFEGLASCLHWNERKTQLPLDSCYAKESVPEINIEKDKKIIVENNNNNEKANNNNNNNSLSSAVLEKKIIE